MSGGSLDYVYSRVEQIRIPPTTLKRRAFAILLQKVAKALHDIEWVDSGDYVPGDEDAAIDVCLQPGEELLLALAEAKAAHAALRAEITKFENGETK